MKYTRETILNKLKQDDRLLEPAETLVQSVFTTLASQLASMVEGDRLELRGIGVFKAVHRKGRRYIDPLDGVTQKMSSGKCVIKFIPSSNAASLGAVVPTPKDNRTFEERTKVLHVVEPSLRANGRKRKVFSVSDHRKEFEDFAANNNPFSLENCKYKFGKLEEVEVKELLDYFITMGTIELDDGLYYVK
jgi:nucleoid DNA-binding protein